MEINLFEAAGKVFTRIKVPVKQYPIYRKLLNQHGITEPTKKNSRFIYFEVEGDLLNNKAVAGQGERDGNGD